jgi:predicted transglutaminase-like cysteine proteinase
MLPLTIMGLAIACAAALLMCLSSLTVLSSALKVGDQHYAESRLLSAQLLLRGEFRYDTTAGLAGVPNVLQRGLHLIRFDVPTLAPMAFTQFCLKYANECKPQRLVFRGGRLKLTDQRWAELETSIAPSIHRSFPSGIKQASPGKNGCSARCSAIATITPSPSVTN